jgi:hypothetical protein
MLDLAKHQLRQIVSLNCLSEVIEISGTNVVYAMKNALLPDGKPTSKRFSAPPENMVHASG